MCLGGLTHVSHLQVITGIQYDGLTYSFPATIGANVKVTVYNPLNVPITIKQVSFDSKVGFSCLLAQNTCLANQFSFLVYPLVAKLDWKL